MECEFSPKRLSEFADKNLSPEEMDKVRKHLSGCSFCRQELKKTEKLYSLLGTDPGAHLPEKYWHSLTNRILKKYYLRKLLYRLIIPFSAAALIVISALFILLLFSAITPESQANPNYNCSAEMAKRTIELSKTPDAVQKAEQIVALMDRYIQKLEEIACANKPEFVEQYALSYCKVAKNGFSRILSQAASQGADTDTIRDIFRKTRRAHIIVLKEVMKNTPEKKQILEKAIHIVTIL